MKELLAAMGFTESESSVYMSLLSVGSGTAAEIAKRTKQARTNTYMVLNKLLERGIVVADDAVAVRRYRAANPQVLERQVREEQRALAQTKRSLDEAMPDLLAMFNLSQQRPGVVHMTGYDGLRASFEDQAKSKTELLVWASDIANQDPKVWQIIDRGGYKRKARSISTRCLFHTGAAQWPHINDFALKGFEVRLWGEQPIVDEVLIYDDRVTFTSFVPEILVTILTNKTLADTFRTVFENCWQTAVPVPSAPEKC